MTDWMTNYVQPPFVDYFIGVDLGKVSDYTALAVLERREAPGGGHRYDVTTLQRGELGTPYPRIVEAVGRLVSDPVFRPRRHHPATEAGPERLADAPLPVLIVDATGVGSAVVDMFAQARLAATLTPLTITSGGQARGGRWPSTGHPAWWVPKIELVGTTQALLQTGRLKIAPDLEHADTLKRELMNFEIRVTQAAHESFGAFREGVHDDLVLAVAMAAWLGEQRPIVRELMVGPSLFGNYRG
jgi:hypothetical protein